MSVFRPLAVSPNCFCDSNDAEIERDGFNGVKLLVLGCNEMLAGWDGESPPKLPLLAQRYFVEIAVVVRRCSDSVPRTTALVCTSRAPQNNLSRYPRNRENWIKNS